MTWFLWILLGMVIGIVASVFFGYWFLIKNPPNFLPW